MKALLRFFRLPLMAIGIAIELMLIHSIFVGSGPESGRCLIL